MKGRSSLQLSFLLAALMLIVSLLEVQAGAPIWSDNFDDYPTGTSLHGVGGWKGWSNSPSFTAYTTDLQARSAPHSVDIVGNSDLVHEYDVGSGSNHYHFYQYIPGNALGHPYFIMLNQYNDSGPYNWSVQIEIDTDTGLIIDTGSGQTMPYVPDQWVEICVTIDLVNDIQSFYYDRTLLYTGSWSDHISGGGMTSVEAVSLLANGSTSIYYDDMTLETGSCFTRGVDLYLSYLPVIVR